MSNEGSKGVVIITWTDISDVRIKSIINNLFMKNRDAISEMKYYEVGAESSAMADTISEMFETQSENDVKAKKKREESRKQKGLEAFC